MQANRPSWQACRRFVRGAVPAALAVLALALPPSSLGFVHLDGTESKQLPDFDSRVSAQPASDQRAAASQLGADVQWNDSGTPASIIKYGGYVATGLNATNAVSAARGWLDANAALFGPGTTTALSVWSSAQLVGSDDAYAVSFRQQAGGVGSTDGIVTVAVVGSSKAGWKIVYASSSLAPSDDATGSFALEPAVAWTEAANDTGADVSIVDVKPVAVQSGVTTLEVNGFSGPQYVKKATFGTTHRGRRAAYQATVVSHAPDGSLSGYDVVVDAQTGELLYRQSIVDEVSDNPTWNAYSLAPLTTPINRFPWNYSSSDTRRLWCWTALNGCPYAAQDTGVSYPLGVASKLTWDVNPNPATGADLGTTQSTGNNVDEIQRWVSTGPRTWGGGYHATSGTRDYQYPRTNAWYESNCDPSSLTGSGNDIDAAIANLFAMHNRMHDYAYYLGFDEPHWNAQQFNNGLGGVANDGVFGNAQASAINGGAPNYGGRDNANMSTGADGGHPQTNMFLWQPLPGAFYAPCVDGDFDMSVIGHEYGHAIENRLIGKGVGARQGTHNGAMGEAFGDFNALEYLNENHYGATAGSDPWTVGAYVTGNSYNGIRDFLASEPMGGDLPSPGHNPKTDPLNLGDYGFDNVGPEVHADGEIWVAVQYDIRDLLLGRYKAKGAQLDIDCARGRVPVAKCPGDRRWIQLYYDAMVLWPRNGTILQARDAMLAADMARFGGADLDLLWLGFAQRGFGEAATVTTNNDTDPVPDFSSPLADDATLTFDAETADGTPVPAGIYVGDYQARVTRIADTDPGTVGPNRDETAQFVPNEVGRNDTYDFVASAPGYGHVRFMVKHLSPGETRNITIEFPANLASATQGASATGDGAGLGNLIDDNEATNWSATGAPAVGRQVVVDLAGTGPVEFKRVKVSALLVPGQNRFTALRSFDLYACTAGQAEGNPTCDGTIAAGWRRILQSGDDAFPAVNPRPAAPDMTLRGWNVPDTTATHVKFVVTANQCTGQPSYQGDQDSDPDNNSDCRVGQAPFVPRDTEVHATELQVFADDATVDGKEVTAG